MSARPPRRSGRPRGAAAILLVLEMGIALLLLIVAGYMTGMLSSGKEEVTARADALAMTTLEAVRRLGPDPADYCRQPELIRLMADWRTRCPRIERVGATAYRVSIDDQIKTIDVPWDIDNVLDDRMQVTARNVTGQIEHHYVNVDEHRPKLVLVLDYSGSMDSGFGGRSRIQALKESINVLLDRDYHIDYGAVLFSSGIITTVPIGRNSVAAVRNAVNGHNAGGMTNYQAALDTARGLFMNQPNQGYYVLFATDGQPTAGNGDGHHQADLLWDLDVTIYTLNIGAQDAFQDLLEDLSGTPAVRHDPNYSIPVQNAAAMRATFDNILAGVLCVSDLDVPREQFESPDRIFVAIEEGGRETPCPMLPYNQFVTPAQHPFDFDRAPYATYEANQGQNGRIRLNINACEHILNGNGAQMLLRYARNGLALH